MIKRKYLWISIVILVIAALPGIFQRWDAEVDNNTYELVTPYEEIQELTLNKTLTMDTALDTLEEAGLTTVSLNQSTLSDWEQQDIIDIYSKNYLKEIVRFTADDDRLPENSGFFTTIPENSYYNNKIKEHFDPSEVTVGNEILYFIADDLVDTEESKLHTYLGYDQLVLDQLKRHDLSYIFRVENTEEHNVNKAIVNDIIKQKDGNSSNVLFSGEEVLGSPNIKEIKELSDKLSQAEIVFYNIEFANQHGLTTIARNVDYDFIRLHSLRLDEESIEVSVDKSVRAVKERNIRSIFFHIPIVEDPLESLDISKEYLSAVMNQMPDQFIAGDATAFKKVDFTLFTQIVTLLAGVLFAFLASKIMKNDKLRIITLIFMIALAALYLLSQKLILLQAFALIIAIITPIYAVISTGKPSANIKSISIQYLKALAISLVGITIVIGLLNGNAFITGFESFRGVKLVYIIPIIFVTIFVMWNEISTIYYKYKGDFMGECIRRTIHFLKAFNVKYWHLIIIGLVGFVFYYYVDRSGNAADVLSIEIIIRQKLEELLYTRPRTKEFLIGFPIFILALHVMWINRKWGRFLLIPATIGFLSIMNTFTHLHIPIYVSILRTIYGVVFGYLIGLLLIYLFNICYRTITKALKAG
ncbi:DUF5693 family protein [Paraliobacillus salinarum]|uniref:DUF5693 family protein n=1 Tax=Paraliobacillus salinarum TaxID=1158996 RepID=UPI0015F749C0|nr:DUF5693 family protein [Paraliobacillus salinarum]